MLTDVYIELHVPDFKRAIEFYSRLGFKPLWRTEDYLVMKRKSSVLNFYGGSQKVYSHSYFGRFKKTTKFGYGTLQERKEVRKNRSTLDVEEMGTS
jgi:catechol 2,3-dioxygenase-like lactoylglutathione lyase family enzyme